MAFVGAVGVAEGFFEDLGFLAEADHLHGNEDQEEQEEPGIAGVNEESGDHHAAKQINRIADFGVQPVRNQGFGLGANGEGFPQLPPRQSPEKK